MTVLSLVAAAKKRPVESVRVAFDAKPYDIFLLKVQDVEFVGIKKEALYDPLIASSRRKCSLVEANMICGLSTSHRVTADGYTLFFRPLTHDEACVLLRAAGDDQEAQLYYPYAQIAANGSELAPGDECWVPTQEFCDELDADEVYFRQTAVRHLTQLGLVAGLAYDPACSTGAFLHGIKQAHPGFVTIGQDLNAGMAAVAKARVDQVFQGDSIEPCIAPESADLLVLRHLNVAVVTSEHAQRLFLASASALKAGGICFVFGHTPVQSPADWYETQGFEVLSRLELTPSGHAMYEFYVLRKRKQPVCAADVSALVEYA